MTELTIEKLKEMNPGETIATGVGTYSEIVEGEIRWVATRGIGYHDWCIYCLRPEATVEKIKSTGDKIHTESVIKRLVPCTDEAFGMYRY